MNFVPFGTILLLTMPQIALSDGVPATENPTEALDLPEARAADHTPAPLGLATSQAGTNKECDGTQAELKPKPGKCLNSAGFSNEKRLIPWDGLILHHVSVTQFTRLPGARVRIFLSNEEGKPCGMITLPPEKKRNFEVDASCVNPELQPKLKRIGAIRVRIDPTYREINTVKLAFLPDGKYCGSMSFKVIKKYSRPFKPVNCLTSDELSGLRRTNGMDTWLNRENGPRLVSAVLSEGHWRFDFHQEDDDERLVAVGILGIDDETHQFESDTARIGGEEGTRSGYKDENGKPAGEWITKDSKGVIRVKDTYSSPGVISRTQAFYPDGAPETDTEKNPEGKRHGKYAAYQGLFPGNPSPVLQMEGQYSNDHPVGTWNHYRADLDGVTQKWFDVTFDSNGFETGRGYYDHDGKPTCQLKWIPTGNRDSSGSGESLLKEIVVFENGKPKKVPLPDDPIYNDDGRHTITEQYCSD